MTFSVIVICALVSFDGSLSVPRNVNVSWPPKPAAGVYVTWPFLTGVSVPWVGRRTIVGVTVSPSGSVQVSVTVLLVPVANVKLAAVHVGALSAAATTFTTSVGELRPPRPSSAWTENWSAPAKPLVGV